MNPPAPFEFSDEFAAQKASQHPRMAAEFVNGSPFPHIVLDDFLPAEHARFLDLHFPEPEHEIWLDWRVRHAGQYGKQGPGDASRFELLDPALHSALLAFNSAAFIRFLETLTGISRLLPDPHFTGGGMHQILQGGILDVHTDFNYYERLDLYRRLNVLVYLTREWRPGYGGELELWDGPPSRGGACVRAIEPLFNRAVVFKTDKTSFHGHPNEWRAPAGLTRRSIALYYYTAEPEPGVRYDGLTDFQGVAQKPLPGSGPGSPT